MTAFAAASDRVSVSRVRAVWKGSVLSTVIPARAAARLAVARLEAARLAVAQLVVARLVAAGRPAGAQLAAALQEGEVAAQPEAAESMPVRRAPPTARRARRASRATLEEVASG